MPITAWIAIGVYVFGIWATCVYAGFVESEDLLYFSAFWPFILLLAATVITVDLLSDAWQWCIEKSSTLDEPKRRAVNAMCWAIKLVLKIIIFPFVLIACPYTVGKWISRRLDEKKKKKMNMSMNCQ